MTKPAHVLALDVGTQSVRALVYARDGRLCARAQTLIEPYVSPEPGWAEQDADVYWQAIGTACADLWAEGAVAPGQIAGVALTTQRATIVFVDADGRPLYPAITWLDARRAADVPRIRRPWRMLFAALGLGSFVTRFQRSAPANWLAAHRPELHAKTRHMLLLSGYIAYRLTGRFVDSTSAQVGYLPFDYKRQAWAKKNDWKWQALAITRAQLPELVAPGAPLGELTQASSAHLGLEKGITVFSAGADKACEVLGAGATTADTACVSLGTTATINTCRTRYREVTRFVPPYPAAMPGAYTDEVQIYRGFWLVSWFKQEFALREVEAAARENRATEAVLDELIAPIAPGADGLVVLPTWSPGVRVPGPEARGAIIGFRDVHTRAHLYRAILEGLAFGLRDGRERIERRTRTPITTLRVAGGGSQSDQAMQILADVFNLPAERSHTFETSGLGAAINAAVGLGWYADHAAAAMTAAGQRFMPRPDAVAMYDGLYRSVYSKLYRKLAPLYREIGTAINGL